MEQCVTGEEARDPSDLLGEGGEELSTRTAESKGFFIFELEAVFGRGLVSSKVREIMCSNSSFSRHVRT